MLGLLSNYYMIYNYFLSYVGALSNEFALDEFFYKQLNVDAKKFGFCPRPSSSLPMLKGRFFFVLYFKIIFPLLAFIAYFLFFSLFLFYYIFKAFTNSFKGSIGFVNVYFLVFCERSLDVFSSYDVNGNSYKYVFINAKASINNANSVDILQLVSLKDVFLAYFLSVASLFYVFFNRRMHHWTLQTYTAFKWFIVYRALSKIKQGELVCAQHYDRWAVISDQLVTRSRLLNPNDPLKLTMMQHGYLGNLNNQLDTLILPYKIKSATTVYVYDQKSADYFTQNIIDSQAGSLKPEYQYFTPPIQLIDVKIEDTATVLIVGNPVCEQFHVSLFLKIKTDCDSNVLIYYKPHPLNPSSVAMKQVGWVYVEEKNFFPKVNVLVSYPSTMIIEYSAHGIKTISHPLNAGNHDVELCFTKVCEHIKGHL